MLTKTATTIAFAATVLAAPLAFLNSNSANADYRWSNPDRSNTVIRSTTRDHDRNHYRPNRHVKRDLVLERRINQRVRNETISLRRLMGIGKNYRGHRIESVVVTLAPRRTHGRVALMVNGHSVDRERLGERRVIRLDPGNRAIVGKTVRSLNLNVRGKATIKSVKVRLSAERPRYVERRPAPKPQKVVHVHRAEPNPWVILNRILASLPAQ